MNKIKVRLLKSTNTVKRRHRATVRGMINRVAYLVRIEA
jgi:ribosomal protein L30/L7E